ncbi:MAG: translation elongation factor-like protein [Candidatus Bathyarchaeia archaeon]
MLREEKLEEVGKVSHYFTKIGVAVINLTAPLSVGDRITIKGVTTDLEQTVDSMQIEHENVTTAKAGQSIGLKVKERVRESDVVYKIV